jgi:hypothetical protein
MKLCLTLALACAASTLCAAEPLQYTISGTLTNQGTNKVTLLYHDASGMVTKTVQATNDRFTLTGPLPERTVVARLNTGVDRNIYMGLTKRSMIIPPPPLEVVLYTNSPITITGTAEDLNLASVTGDELNNTLNALRQAELDLLREHRRLSKQIAELKIMGADDRLQSEVGPKMMENMKARKEVRRKFVLEHPTSYISLFVISTTTKEFEPAELKDLFSHLDAKLRDSEFGKEVAQMIENAPARRPAKAAPGAGTNRPPRQATP